MRLRSFGFGLLLLVALAACGGGDDPSAGETTAQDASASTDETAPPAVVEIDPAVVLSAEDYEKRVVEAIPVSGQPDFNAADFGAVWVANFGTGTLDRIDPATSKVVARVKVGRDSCAAIATGFGSIWVPVCGAEPEVVRVDAKTNEVVARIPVNEVLGESGIGVDESGAWLLTAASGELSRIDPETNQVAATYPVADGSSVVQTGFGSVWVANTNTNAVQRVDEASGEIVATIPVGKAPRFMAAGEGAVWVTNQADGDLSRIDPETNEVVATIDIGEYFQGGDVEAGLGSVWASTGDGPLSRIDPALNTVVEHYEENGADAIAIGEGAIWISDHNVKTVFKLAPE